MRERHSNNPRGNASMSLRIVAPVVVKPLIVSKNASVYDVQYPDSLYGNAPTNEAISHEKPVIPAPSRIPIVALDVCRVVYSIIALNALPIVIDSVKASKSSERSYAERVRGNIIIADVTRQIYASTRNTSLIFMRLSSE